MYLQLKSSYDIKSPFTVNMSFMLFTFAQGYMCTWCSPLGKCTEMVYRIMLLLMTLTHLSFYCLFYYVACLNWFYKVKFTFIYQFLLLDSDDALYPSSLSVLYKYSCLVNLFYCMIDQFFLSLYLNHVILYNTMISFLHSVFFFTFLILWFIYVFVHY